MGWWSCTVMGGDEPLDDLSIFGDECCINFDAEEDESLHGWAFTREMVEGNIDKLVKAAGNDAIMWHVLGVIIMWTGAEMSDRIRKMVIKAANGDPWANEEGWSSERGKHVEAFVKTVEGYKPGARVEVDYESLWDNFAKLTGN